MFFWQAEIQIQINIHVRQAQRSLTRLPCAMVNRCQPQRRALIDHPSQVTRQMFFGPCLVICPKDYLDRVDQHISKHLVTNYQITTLHTDFAREVVTLTDISNHSIRSWGYLKWCRALKTKFGLFRIVGLAIWAFFHRAP
ncbi:MAG TPA: hypothetical protein PKM01_10665 [Anaerolineaceae bacterium]|nr:hypothetical protein [Anaerolineaceae bacterium]